ncbi:MAG: cytochrome c biogenesis CcdA family protein [Mycobacteriales bacterium]
MSNLLLTSTILTAFLGGVVALLAPCCISVMLPAYFASTFQRRTQIAAMTLVFAAGVATVILPIALGARLIAGLLIEQHRVVFTVGGTLMVLGGVAMLAGQSPRLPMPMGGPSSSGRGVRATYGLGVFSGGASACCAPVLAGAAALAGATASFPVALAVGVAYVFGMVAPLVALALLWDRRDWGSSRLLSGRTVTWWIGPVRRTLPLGYALSGGLLVLMGGLTLALAPRGPGMANDGWQVEVSAWLQHAASTIARALSGVPGWVTALLIFGALVLFLRAALRRTADGPSDDACLQIPPPDVPLNPTEKLTDHEELTTR